MPDITAKIYQPAKSATQSARKNEEWTLEFTRTRPKFIDPVMGWHGSSEMQPGQVKLKFPTLNQAEEYAKNNNIRYTIERRNSPKISIRNYNKNYT
jgi:hypothetical protein